MTRFPITLEDDDNGTVLASFPDFPEAVTFGDTKDEALTRARDALETVIEAYISDRRPIPEPSATTGEAVDLPAIVAAKVQIYQTMLAARVNKTELARRLQVHLPQIDRLLDLRHGSKLDQLEAAARALGKRLEVSLSEEPSGVPVKSAGTVVVFKAARRRAAQHPVRRVHRGGLESAARGVSVKKR